MSSVSFNSPRIADQEASFVNIWGEVRNVWGAALRLRAEAADPNVPDDVRRKRRQQRIDTAEKALRLMESAYDCVLQCPSGAWVNACSFKPDSFSLLQKEFTPPSQIHFRSGIIFCWVRLLPRDPGIIWGLTGAHQAVVAP